MQKVVEKDRCIPLIPQLQKDRDRIQTSLKVRFHLHFGEVKNDVQEFRSLYVFFTELRYLCDEGCFNPVAICRKKKFNCLFGCVLAGERNEMAEN